MKKTSYMPFGETYTIQDVKRDSDRGLAAFAERWWAKFVSKTESMRKENQKYSGPIINCLLAVGFLALLGVNGWA